MTCKARTACREKLAVLRCKISAVKKWTELTHSSSQGRQHAPRKFGPIIWCGVCGCFAETRANGLTGMCKGMPPQQLGPGGRRAQLNNLRAGLHPVTYARLPETTKLNGDRLQGDGVYSRLKQTNSEAESEKFMRYVPEIFAPSRPQLSGRTAEDKRRRMHGRIKFKEASEARRLRKLRSLEAIIEARILYENFVGCDVAEVGTMGNPKPCEEAELCQVCEANGGSDEEFWNGLCEVRPPAPRADSHVKRPWECIQRTAKPSRMQRLTAS